MAEKKFFVDINLQGSDINNLRADTLDITTNLASANTKRIVYWSGQYYYSDGTSWIALGGSGNLPAGGATGDILAKASGTDYDVEWISNYTSTVQHEVKAGVALTKGQAVYVSSANGTNMIVSKASNASESTSSKTMGLVASSAALNDIIFVITEGLLTGTGSAPLDTSSATEGDPVWLGTNGNLIFGLTNKPVAPAHLVFLGIVTRVSATVGEIFVKVQNGFELGELHDVDALNASNNDGLFYNTTTSLWEHKSIATALGYTPENQANKSTSTSLGTSDTLYPTQNAVKVYADNLLGNANALVYKGTIDCSTNPDYPAADAGWMYIASVAGKIGGASGTDVEVGDMIICNTDGTVSGDQATVGQYWNVIQKNIVGAVTGPASSINNTLPVFDGTTGKIIKQGIITDTGSRIGVDIISPTAKLHISNITTDDSFLVEDSTNPDSTPFIINNAGNVGIGTTNPLWKFQIQDAGGDSVRINVPDDTKFNRIFFQKPSQLWSTGSINTNDFVIADETASVYRMRVYASTGNIVFNPGSTGLMSIGVNSPSAKFHINNTTSSNSFLVEDATNPDSSPFVIDATGSVGIGRQPTNYKLDVAGSIYGYGLGSGTFGITGENNGDSAGTYIGVKGSAAKDDTPVAGNAYIGGWFYAFGGNSYSVMLQDGTEGVAGRFLKNMDTNGKANWATLTVADTGLTLTTTGSSGAATLTGNTLNIPTYESSLIPKLQGNEIWRGSTFRNNSTTIDTTAGIILSTTGTNTARSVGTTSYAARGIRLGVAATTASVGRYQGMRGAALLWYVTGGFLYTGEFNISDTAFVTGTHNFWGLASSTSDLLIGGVNNDQPSALTNIIAFANDSGDANLQIMYNDASGTATKTDLGASFPSNRTAGAAVTTIYACYLYNAPNSNNVIYRIVNKETGAVAQGTLTTNLPASTVGLNFFGARTMGTPLGGVNNSGQFDVYRLGVYSL
jgi:hypothetical protein